MSKKTQVTLSVPVLANDILRCERCSSKKCMVAGAVKRFVRPSLHNEVSVDSSVISVGDVTTKPTAATSSRIERWDKGATDIKPFNVRVRFNIADLRLSIRRNLGL